MYLIHRRLLLRLLLLLLLRLLLLLLRDEGKRRLLLVCVSVLDHSVFPDEPLPADLAGERLLPRVQTHVTTEVGLVVELLRADVALVGLITGVFRKMLLKKSRGEKKTYQSKPATTRRKKGEKEQRQHGNVL